jgi:short-subunit dehydrogenase
MSLLCEQWQMLAKLSPWNARGDGLELAPHGVGVSALCPGYVQTNLAANTARIGGDIRQYTAAMPASDVTPADVGRMVIRGIEADAPYILTHPDAWPGIEKRMLAIKAACEVAEAG